MIKFKVDYSKNLKTKYDRSLFITFNYDPDIVNIIKKCKVRSYDKENYVWQVDLGYYKPLVKALSNYDIALENKFDKENPLKIISNIEDNELFLQTKSFLPSPDLCENFKDLDFDFKTKPFKHQLDAFYYGISNKNICIADEMGLGKSMSAITIASARKKLNDYKHCLIVCCVNSTKYNWLNEINTHSFEKGHLIGSSINKKGKLVIKSSKDKLNDLRNIDKINDYFLIINIESFRNEEIVEEISNLCDKNIINMCIVDEFHKISSPNASQTVGLLNINPDSKIALTGTPIRNSPLDIFPMLKWLGFENYSYWQFRGRYCRFGGYKHKEIISYKNLNEINAKLSNFFIRRRKEDVLDLPEKTYIDDYVELNDKQLSIYKEVLDDLIKNIDLVKSSPNPLSHLTRLRQATGYTGILSSKIVESAKLDRLNELMEEIVANGRKAIIFSNWKEMVYPFLDNLNKKYNGVCITGDTKDEDRQIIVDNFNNDNSINFIIGTIGALGTGLTINSASVVIFIDEPYTNANKEQAVDRCHRIGQNKNVFIYTLLAKNTIDEKIHKIVNTKNEIASILIDNESQIANDKNKIDKLKLINYLLIS